MMRDTVAERLVHPSGGYWVKPENPSHPLCGGLYGYWAKLQCQYFVLQFEMESAVHATVYQTASSLITTAERTWHETSNPVNGEMRQCSTFPECLRWVWTDVERLRRAETTATTAHQLFLALPIKNGLQRGNETELTLLHRTLLISTPPHFVPENSLCAPISLPTVVQWRVSGGVGTASVWGRTETSNGSLRRTNPNTFSPQSLLASVQMVCVIYDIPLIRIFLSHMAMRCPYLWASWQAAAACWWFGGWAAERRAASVTCPP